MIRNGQSRKPAPELANLQVVNRHTYSGPRDNSYLYIGRGTPLGFPVPTLKISSNTAIAEKKPHWIDLNAGAFLDGTATMDQLADELFALIIDVASGRALANNEKHGYREIAIWKEGVTL